MLYDDDVVLPEGQAERALRVSAAIVAEGDAGEAQGDSTWAAEAAVERPESLGPADCGDESEL